MANRKKFLLVKISGRKFNAKKQRNEPTEYQVFFNDWIVETIVVAQNEYEKDWRRLNTRDRAVRKAARDVIHSKKDSPPLETVITRTLSTPQAFDREDVYIDAALERQRQRLHLNGKGFESYGKKKRLQIQMIETNISGSVGDLLTPEIDVPQKPISAWNEIDSGLINEVNERLETNLKQKLESLIDVDFDRIEYASQVVRSENREIIAPSRWENGKWSSFSNSIPIKESELLPKGQIHAKTCTNLPQNTRKSLNSLNVEGTFSDEVAEIDFSVSTPEQIEDFRQSLSIETIREIVSHWTRQVAEKLPDAPPSQLQEGVWQFYRFESHTAAQKDYESVLTQMIILYADGTASFNDLKSAFLDYAMTRVSFWQNKVETNVGQSKLDTFRARLDEYLKLPEDCDDG